MSATSIKAFFIMLTGFLIISCGQPTPYDHIDSEEVRFILEKGITKAGGLEAWYTSPGYQFKERRILYLEDGSIESKSTQIVRIKDQPKLEGSITWNNRSDTLHTVIEYQENRATKYIDEVDQGEEINEAAGRSFLETHNVMSMPFKLLDQGVSLTYGGEEQQYGKQVKVLVVDYNTENGNHTESQRWWHYFDTESYDYLGYKVYLAPTYTLAKNLKTTKINGITYPVDRITWRVDSLDNKKYIRAKFAYSDFESMGK